MALTNKKLRTAFGVAALATAAALSGCGEASYQNIIHYARIDAKKDGYRVIDFKGYDVVDGKHIGKFVLSKDGRDVDGAYTCNPGFPPKCGFSKYTRVSNNSSCLPEGKGSGRFFKQLPPDQHASDFGCARADLVKFGVAQQTAGRILVDIAVAAQTLDRLQRHPCRLFRRV